MSTFGIYNINKDGYNKLKIDSKVVTKVSEGADYKFGVQDNTEAMLLDSKPIVNGETQFGSYDKNGTICINGVSMTNETNISTNGETYSKLSKQKVPAGYKRFDPKYDYTIKKLDLVENEETEATFTKILCPMVTLRPYKSRIKRGERLAVYYFVDTFYMDSIHKDEFNDTFTIIVENSDGEIVHKQTRYAGEGVAVIGPFNTPGENWFGIRAIDQDGCSSPAVFGDFLVEEEKEVVEYQVTQQDLLDYGVTVGHLQEQYDSLTKNKPIGDVRAQSAYILQEQKQLDIKAYRNKLGLTKLFSYKKYQGYNYVKLPENSYIEISLQRNLYLGEDRADYEDPFGVIEPSTTRYFKIKTHESGGKYYCDEVIELTWDEFDYDCWKGLWKDLYPKSYNYYKTHNREVQYPILNSSSYITQYPNRDIIKSRSDIPATKRVISNGSSGIPQVGKVVPEPSKINNKPNPFNPENGRIGDYNYFVNNRFGNTGLVTVNLPNEFTLDMNGSKFKAYDSTSACNEGGDIIYLINNFDTHIINGSLEGTFGSFSFHQGSVASIYGVPFEMAGGILGPGLASFSLAGCKYCSLEDLDIGYILGYEGNVGSLNVEILTADTSRQVMGIRTNDYYPDEPKTVGANSTLVGNINGKTKINFSNYSNRYINLNGEITDIETPSNIPVYDTFYMGVSDLFNVIPYKDRNVSEIYASVHHGASHVMFIAVYDASGKFIKLIKTHKWFPLRLPKNAVKARAIVYGKPGAFNTSDFNKGGCWPHEADSSGINTDIQFTGRAFCLNCDFTRIHWHDTRTTAIHPDTVEGITYDNCTWQNISVCKWFEDAKYCAYFVTDAFGDFEEGNECINRVTVSNCEVLETDPRYSRRSTIGFRRPNTFNFINNKNMGLKTSHLAVMRGIVKGNHLEYLGGGSRKDYENPHMVIKDNVIDSMHPDGIYWIKQYNKADNNIALYVFNKIQVNNIYTITDSVFKTPLMYTPFNLHRIQNGNQIID